MQLSKKEQASVAVIVFLLVLAIASNVSQFFPEETEDDRVEAEYFSGFLGVSALLYTISIWILDKKTDFKSLLGTLILVTPSALIVSSIMLTFRVAVFGEKTIPALSFLAFSVMYGLVLLPLAYILIEKNDL